MMKNAIKSGIKRIILVLIAVLMLFAMTGCIQYGIHINGVEVEYTKDGFGVVLSSDGESYAIYGMKKDKGTDIVLPSSYNDKPITGILSFPHLNMKSIMIPSSIVYIEDNPFITCQNLEKITVESGNTVYHSSGNCLIETVTKKLIAGCNTSIIPDDGSVEVIGEMAFLGRTELSSFTIPDSVVCVEYRAFEDCTNLIYNEYDNAYYLGNDTNPYVALIKCKSTEIASCNIYEKTQALGGGAFSQCANLETITFPDSIVSIGGCAFMGCDNLKEITIPESVAVIGESAFSGCSSLTSINIPNNLKSIGDMAFKSCKNLEEVHITDIAKWCNISFEGSVFSSYKLYMNGELVTDFVIPNGVTTIGSGLLSGCKSIESVTIPASVEYIGRTWDSNAQVQVIPNSPFEGCYNLSSIMVNEENSKYHSNGNCLIETATKTLIACCDSAAIPDDGSVTVIGDGAFDSCRDMVSVMIPACIMRIEDLAFLNCSNLIDVYFAGTEEEWAAISIGGGNDKLKNATIHYGNKN